MEILKKITKRKVLTFLSIVLYLGAIIITMHVNDVNNIKTLLVDNLVLEKVYYVVQIITGLCVILSAIIGVWQYYLSTKCELTKQSTETVQKSIDLAEYYRTNVLDKYEILYYIYNDVGLLNIIKNIRLDQMREFDNEELMNVLSETQISEIQRIRKSQELVESLMRVEMTFGIDLGIKEYIRVKGGDGTDIEVNTSAILRRYANCIVMEVLNCLEYFAMHFEHNTADESVVYQSLHQTYLDLIQMLYCEIAAKNKVGHKKYYTNVIGLYNKWYKRYEQKRVESAQRDREGVIKGTVIEKLN